VKTCLTDGALQILPALYQCCMFGSSTTGQAPEKRATPPTPVTNTQQGQNCLLSVRRAGSHRKRPPWRARSNFKAAFDFAADSRHQTLAADHTQVDSRRQTAAAATSHIQPPAIELRQPSTHRPAKTRSTRCQVKILRAFLWRPAYKRQDIRDPKVDSSTKKRQPPSPTPRCRCRLRLRSPRTTRPAV